MDFLVNFLRRSTAVRDKVDIRKAYRQAVPTLGTGIRIGDDCAAIPDGAGGHLLFAGEAMNDAFVADEPWFAGYSAVMVNINDICAMGGRPTAIVDMLWSPSYQGLEPVWDGMRAASRDYAVPIVGGHTTIAKDRPGVGIAASVLGRADALLTTFDARPGDAIVMAVDLNGAYHGQNPFWNASSDSGSERLQRNIALLPEIAEQGWSGACRDISNGGIVGTLIMMLECSGVGARLDLGRLPMPPGIDLGKWLISFPSFGFLFAVTPEWSARVKKHFRDRDIDCRTVGEFTETRALDLTLDGETRTFWTCPKGT